MLRPWIRAAAMAAFSLSLTACAQGEVKSATGDVQALLAAVQAGNVQAFEAHIDRAALRSDLRGKLIGIARADDVVVDGGPSDLALDRRIGPDAFTLTRAGRPLAAAPSAAETQAILKVVDPTHVCVRDAGPSGACLLTFAREKPGWRLVSMPAQPGVQIEVPPAPTK